LVSSVTYVTDVVNAAAAVGGADRETLANARVAYRATASSLQRAVSPADFEYLAKQYVSPQYGRIATAKAINPGGSLVRVVIVPRVGGAASAGLRTDLTTYLTGKKAVCTSVQVIGATYVAVNVTATVHGLAGYGATTIETNVRQALTALLSPTYQNDDGEFPNTIGRDISLSDIYAAIKAADGVNYCTLTMPTGDITITNEQIADVGTFAITVVTA
jgi:phage-related baseplate assembly protein